MALLGQCSCVQTKQNGKQQLVDARGNEIDIEIERERKKKGQTNRQREEVNN